MPLPRQPVGPEPDQRDRHRPLEHRQRHDETDEANEPRGRNRRSGEQRREHVRASAGAIDIHAKPGGRVVAKREHVDLADESGRGNNRRHECHDEAAHRAGCGGRCRGSRDCGERRFVHIDWRAGPSTTATGSGRRHAWGAGGWSAAPMRTRLACLVATTAILAAVAWAQSIPSIVTTSPLPDGTLGQSYSQTLAATGGFAPYLRWVDDETQRPLLA